MRHVRHNKSDDCKRDAVEVNHQSDNGHTRRTFLKLSAGGALTTLWALQGCGLQGGTATAGEGDVLVDDSSAEQVDELSRAGGEPLIRPAHTPLRLAMVGLPVNLDPSLFEVIEAYPFGMSVYDGLVWLDQALMPQPMLATSWESAPDGLAWTVTLRRDVSFHHGTPFTATDVVHTFTRLLDPTRDTTFGTILNFIATVEAINDYTVRFALNTPNVEFPMLLAAPQTYIVPHDYADDMLASQPSGTGPFMFVELVPGSRMSFVKNPTYWAADQIMIEEMQFIAINTFEGQVTALQEGDIDLLLDLRVQDLPQLQENPQILIDEQPSGRYQNLAMQVSAPPFDNPLIRQALKHCMDRVALRQLIIGQYGAVANDHPIPPLNPLWSDLPALDYDPEKARALLVEAGYPDGLKLQLLTAAAAPGMVLFAEAFRDMAAAATVEVEVVEVKVTADIYFSEYWGRVPFYVSAWEYRPTLHETFGIAYRSDSPWNETGWSSPELDQLLLEAASEQDDTERRELYQAAEQIMIEDGAVIIPFFLPSFIAMRNTIQGLAAHPAGWLNLRGVQTVTSEG